MTDTKNKVTIPLKKHSKKVTIEDLKTNLLKHLPKIVSVNQAGYTVLSSDEKERIGRVLPIGSRLQETADNDTSR